LGRPRRHRTLVLSTCIGLAFVAVDPIIVYGIDPDAVGHMTKLRLHLFVGLPALMIGLFACAPLLAMAIEACCGWVTARLFAVPPVLLKQQLTGGLWRTAGTAAALMVGLAALTAIQTQGHSTLKSWKLPNRFPDLIVLSTSFLGIQENQIRKMESMEGVDPESVMPMVMVTPGLGTFIAALSGPQKLAEKTIMFGIDPVKAFGTENSEPRIELDFIQGDLVTAQKKLSSGRYILVSEEFYKLKEKGLGDQVELETPAGKVQYEIAGVVRSAGADLIMRMYTLENEFEQWTTAAVLTSLKNVEKDFGKQLVRVVLLNLKSQENKAAIEKKIKKALGQTGLQTADSRQIKNKIDTSIQTLMLLLNIIAMSALGVAALGVANTMVASVRSRQWQLGILRSQGLGRGALIRLIVSEAFLIGALATLMGLGAGWMAALWGNRVSLELFSFAPSLVPPWSKLSIGVAVTVATAVLASLWPAFQVAYTQTLRLLRADRAAT
ncbi:MAG: ABC transporter permease, partial [Phycisphaeraceae bacterium]|nr:ABC transporter permease [Phycisphaeraceae bacterium]